MAVTWRVSVMISVQSSLPVQAPLQPAKFEPGAAAAVKVTTLAAVKAWVQSSPQSMPGGSLLTTPLPSPDSPTVRV